MAGKLLLNFNVMMTFGIILVAGSIAGKIANFFKLPKVTGYIAIGVLLEPSLLGILPQKLIDHSAVISNMALCIITYAIGGSLQFKRIKKLGITIPLMTVMESLMTFFMVFAGIYLLLPLLCRYTPCDIKPVFYLPLALLAGALASPTDPTPTLAVKEEYKAEGPVMTTILGIGAFDDALGIINFAIALAASAAIVSGVTGSIGSIILPPLADIFFSFLTGIVFGAILLLVAKKVTNKGVLVVLIMGFLFLCYGVAEAFNLDELLSTMTMGCMVVNLCKDEEKFFMSVRDYFEESVFVIFFVVAGANLKLDVLKDAVWIVLVFAIFRILGKVLGAYLGAVLSRAQDTVRKYTAFGLIPQGGIIVGLALVVTQNPQYSNFSDILLNIILGTTVLFEFIGPLFTEIALKKAGEVGKMDIRGYTLTHLKKR